MDQKPVTSQIVSIVRAGIIMPWIGFIMIIPLIMPLFMLFAAPLRTMEILYSMGFVPSIAAATVYQIGKGRLHPIPLVVMSALSGGVFCISWQMLLGVSVHLEREPEPTTIIAMTATAIYFTLISLLARWRRPESSH